MLANYLRRSENEYELKIRGLPTTGNANELRTRLSQALKNNAEINEEYLRTINIDSELEECEEKLNDLSSLAQDYEGNTKDNEYRRLTARLWHLYLRVERIPTIEDTDSNPESATRNTELSKKSKSLLDNFISLSSKAFKTQPTLEETIESLEIQDQHKNDTSTQNIMGEGTSNDCQEEFAISSENRNSEINQEKHNSTVSCSFQRNFTSDGDSVLKTKQTLIETETTKFVPVYKWGLQFNNSPGQSIGAFLQRVEELRHARGVTEAQLFRSAVDLFTGNALIWYRSTVGRICSWAELCTEMKMVFQTPDYDDMLLQEIMNRTQGESEHIDLFIASMEGLYGRLSSPVAESVRLRQILKNLNHYLQDKLCMFMISSLDELRTMGRKAELGRLRASNIRPPPRPSVVLEPDLAYSHIDFRRNSSNHQVHTLNKTTNSTHTSKKCWNCKGDDHLYSNCTKDRKLVCYGCGHAGYRKTNCPKCNPKNGARREPPQSS